MEKIKIAVRGDTSDESVKLFKEVCDKLLKYEKIGRVKIYYDKNKGMPDVTSNPDEWSLQLWTKGGNIKLCIYNCTAGYYGSGSCATEEILKIVGLDERTIKKIVHEETNGIVDKDFYLS